ncbi:MAG: hypothetical protein ACI9BW_001582 [Gammaproteobacteria bacterium]|jgi:hypothetical protein
MTLPKVSLRIAPSEERLLNLVPTLDDHGKTSGVLLVSVPDSRENQDDTMNLTNRDSHDALKNVVTEIDFADSCDCTCRRLGLDISYSGYPKRDCGQVENMHS